MDQFRSRHYTGVNQHGKKIRYCFVSKRLGGLLQRKKDVWLHKMFDLKQFTMFDNNYLAILMNTDGLIIFVKHDGGTPQHVERGMCEELMSLFIRKNINLSFTDLIKFSDKHGINLEVKFK